MSYRSLFTAAALVALSAVSASAQGRAEVSVFAGYTFSDGVTGQGILAGDGNVYNAIDLKDSGLWGFMIGVNASDNVEVGFMFGQQMTTLAVEGTATRDVGDTNVNTYHGYVSYNFGEADATVRPYLLFGGGATSYGGVSFTRANGQTAEIGSETQFSGTLGAGVKAFTTPNFGVRFGMLWTPTYIKSDPGGWWCDPYWGCYVVGDAQYSNQFTLNGGVVFRF
jgi:hypothetical protein